jgi:lipopolysaccharide transport system ATP-binding protein
MSDAVISVEQLGKKYQIDHLAVKGTYKTLRETLTHQTRDLLSGWFSRNGNGRAPKRAHEEFWALKDVSFEVKQGEVLGIIGRNGAGKSTLLKILSRITEPTEGRVRIRGRVASLLEVGTGFHPELTGRENIYLNGAILGMAREEIKRKFDEIVDFAGTEKFLDTPVKRYSSGMYVRLAFAVAAHLEPEVLIVDEVLAVGDAEFQNKCLGKMEDVSKGGRTVLFVSHNIAAVRRLCRSGILLSNGAVREAGTISKVTQAYGESTSSNSAGFLDHFGRTKVEVESVHFLVNGVKCDSISTGETFAIQLGLSFNESVMEPISIGFALENMTGIFVMINYSSFSATRFAPKKSLISAVVPDAPFVEGSYKLHLRILSGEEEIFWSQCLTLLRIGRGDFFGTGIRGEESLCPWLHKLEWSQVG